MEHHGSQAATEPPKESPMSPRKAGQPADAATLARPAAHSTPRHRVEITRRSRTTMRVNAPRRPTHTDPDRPVRNELADHATLTLPRSTTPATTLASGGPPPPGALGGRRGGGGG